MQEPSSGSNPPHPRLEAEKESGAEPSSLSMSHNSDAPAAEVTPNLPFVLTGSQKKTAHALRINAERLCREAGIERIGFLTLTVGDADDAGRFEPLHDAEEASRRFNNLNRRLLGDIFSRCIVVMERTRRGAVHYHAIGELAEDVRSGFDFEAHQRALEARRKGQVDHAAESRYKRAASPFLRNLWAILRERLPGLGFGRAELTPVRKCGEAISAYVSKYVEKHLFCRLDEDKGKRLVRYVGWNKTHLKANGFSWATKGATEWRLRARLIAATVGIQRKETMAETFGPRWAFKTSEVMQAVNWRAFMACDARQIDHVRDWMRRLAPEAVDQLLERHWQRQEAA